ncbi:MAG: heavy-metal-associated domain-containing protein [Coprococcus sp.]
MVKTVLKIDGMMCGMCEAHMNDLIRKNFKVKKVTSSAKDGETVIISDAELDIPWAKKQIKDIGYELIDYTSEPYEKKGLFHFGRK